MTPVTLTAYNIKLLCEPGREVSQAGFSTYFVPASPDLSNLCSGSETVLGTFHPSLHPFLTTVHMCKQGIPLFIDEDTETQRGPTAVEWQRQNSKAASSISTLGRFSHPAVPRMWLLGQQHQGSLGNVSETYIFTQPRLAESDSVGKGPSKASR